MNVKTHPRSRVPLLFAMIIPLFTGYGGSFVNLITVIEIAIAIYYINDDTMFVMAPIFVIYYSQLLLIGESLGGFNIYMMLCCFKLCMQRRVLIWKVRPIAGLAILLVYSALVMFVWQGLWSGFILAINGIGTIYVATRIRYCNELRQRFQTVMVAMCLSATLYGILFINIKGIYEQTNGLIYYSGRYCGTTSDPNYMAFFYCISVVYISFSSSIKSWLKYTLVAVFVFATAITGSLTALLSICVTFFFYMIWGEKGSVKKRIVAVALMLAAGFFLYLSLFTDVIEITAFTIFKARLAEKLQFLNTGDLSGATSGRTEYSGEYTNYLFQQNIIRILFGGYQLNSMGLAGEAFERIRFAAHNTYVDVLMTCGIIGLGLFIYRVLSGIYSGYRLWSKHNDLQGLADAVLLIIMAIFVAGLSCFPSPGYMLFFLL